MKIIHASDKKNAKLKERLEELGYDVWGKKSSPRRKPTKSSR